VAVVLVAGAAALFVVSTGQWRKALRLLHPVGVIVWVAVTLPWYVLCAWRNPEFLSTFLISHNVERFLTPVFQHVQPFWFFGPILMLGVAPWTLPLFGLFATGLKAFREKAARDTPQNFLACTVVFILLFFSLSRSKLPGYILPALFPIALLLALWLCDAMVSRSATVRWALAGVGFFFCLLASTTTAWQRKLPEGVFGGLQAEALVWIILAFAGGAIIAGLAFVKRPWPAFIACLLLTAGMVEGINQMLLPRLDSHITPRAAARAISEIHAPVSSFQLHRAWRFGLDFYLRRELAAWNPLDKNSAIVVSSSKGAEQIRAMGRQVKVRTEFSAHAVLVEIEAIH
jgi:4-amino-4-deoxy-L-arabinose transferase-like glycosyltransferase